MNGFDAAVHLGRGVADLEYLSDIAPALSLNTWYYIAATYDGNNVELYVDGTQVASGTLAGGYTPSSLAHGDRRGELVSATYGDYTIGSINQFAFYSSALTANQITATYDATLALSQPAYEGYGIFNVAAGVTVSITGLTLGDGDAVDGGAFNNAGTLTITGTQFVQDSAPAAPAQGQAGNAYGGALYNATGGVLTVTDSAFINDAALGGEGQVSGSNAGSGGNAYGGAIYNARGRTAGSGRRHLCRRLRHRRQRRQHHEHDRSGRRRVRRRDL